MTANECLRLSKNTPQPSHDGKRVTPAYSSRSRDPLEQITSAARPQLRALTAYG